MLVFALLYNMPSCELNAVLVVSTVIVVRLVQPEKAEQPILVTPFPIVTLVRLVQLIKAELPMLVTLFGMVTLVRLVHW